MPDAPLKALSKAGRVKWIRAALLSCAAAFVLTGGARGEIQIVLVKAANLCLECIGIG